MAHLNLIPDLLDALVTENISAACRRVGINTATYYRYLLRSKAGDPELQEIEWYGVKCPFHIHATANVSALASQAIERSAMVRASEGCWVPSYYMGSPVWQTLDTDETDPDILELMFGQRDRIKRDPITHERLQVMQWLKPDSQLTIAMLQAWSRKRYSPHSTVDVSYGGVLRLERADEVATKTVEHKQPIFEDDADDQQQRGGQLALGRPAKDSAELDRWAAQGEFAPTPVDFIGADGARTTLQATPDPLLPQPGDRPDIAAEKRKAAELLAHGPKNPYPVDRDGRRTMPSVKGHTADDDIPDAVGAGHVADDTRTSRDTTAKPYAKPVAGSGVMGRGAGPVPRNVGGAVGFKQS